MTIVEKEILQNENNDKTIINLDYKEHYSDEFYEEFVSKFEQNNKKRILYRCIKRAFDIITSFLAITILAIPFIVVAIFIKCDSKGPVFFKNKRIGKNGKVFSCLKFRSMKVEAPSDVATNQIQGDYVTKVGHFLRKTSIDELPQLFNVFIGQMSIIGYRPLVIGENNCNELREKLGVLKVRPGISGYSQVHGRDDVYYKNKAIMDAYYVKHRNLWIDFKLIFESISVAISGSSNWDKKQKKQKS